MATLSSCGLFSGLRIVSCFALYNDPVITLLLLNELMHRKDSGPVGNAFDFMQEDLV